MLAFLYVELALAWHGFRHILEVLDVFNKRLKISFTLYDVEHVVGEAPDAMPSLLASLREIGPRGCLAVLEHHPFHLAWRIQ